MYTETSSSKGKNGRLGISYDGGRVQYVNSLVVLTKFVDLTKSVSRVGRYVKPTEVHAVDHSRRRFFTPPPNGMVRRQLDCHDVRNHIVYTEKSSRGETTKYK